MKEQPKINSWVLKQKELLEKLTNEISSNFSIPEKLAKKLIYETHLSLDGLRLELRKIEKKKGDNQEEESIDDKKEFNDKVEKLFFILAWARELIWESSKTEIQKLKKILKKIWLNEDITFVESDLIKKIFSKKLVLKAKNPKNISDQIMWASLWITNSTIIITDVLYRVWKGFVTSVPDLISILSWRWEIESIKKV